MFTNIMIHGTRIVKEKMHNLARNMAFLIRAIADAKEKYGLQEMESDAFTSFPDGK